MNLWFLCSGERERRCSFNPVKKMKLKLLWIMFLMFGVNPFSIALVNAQSNSRSWVKASQSGRYLFKMVPEINLEGEDGDVLKSEAFGVAYKVTRDGKFEELWRTIGWYAPEGYLSDDGRYFVRVEKEGRDPLKLTDLALAFYDQGKLIKAYQVRDLVKDHDFIQLFWGHCEWRPLVQSKPDGFYDNTFHWVTAEKTAYSFNFKTGEVVNSERDEGAKNKWDLIQEQLLVNQKKGVELFNASKFKQAFESQFELKNIEASFNWPSGATIEDPVWSADLIPKQKFGYKVNVWAVFPIKERQHVEVSLTPQEIISAIEKAFKYPSIRKRLKETSATGLRLRIRGDRLHMNTEELAELIEKATGEKPKDKVLANWAYLIIDAKKPQYTTIYFNTKTEEIICDLSKRSSGPCMFDAKGNLVKKAK